MAKKLLKTELEEIVRKYETRMAHQDKELRDLKDQRSEFHGRINTLKSVARHYKSERDSINGYLSGILDLVIEREEIEVPADPHSMMYTGPVRKEKGFPPLMRPSISEPHSHEHDDPYGFGRAKSDKLHWEDY